MAIKLKNGKLEVSVYDPNSPSKKRYGGRFPDTQAGRRAAKKREAELIDEIQGGESNNPETINEFRARWRRDFPNGQRGLRQESTWVIYVEKTKPFVEEFGKRAMRSFTRKEAQRFARRKPHHARAVQAMFSDAYRDEVIDLNPFLGAHAARSRGRADIEVIEYEVFEKIVKHAEAIGGPPFKALVLLAGLTAFHEGETFGVAIEDFNVADSSVEVRWQYRSKTSEYARPKNGEPRTVYVPPVVMDAVRPLLLREVERGDPKRPQDGRHILLLTPRGKHYTARSHDYYWRQVRAAAGVPKMQFHELKHFAASYYLNELDIDSHHIAHQIAHKDLDLLFDLYGHPSEKKAREAFRRAFGGHVRRLRDVSEENQEEDGRGAAG